MALLLLGSLNSSKISGQPPCRSIDFLEAFGSQETKVGS